VKKIAIIVAGGSGRRMETGTPKQFLLLNNLPVLYHTLNCFTNFQEYIDIVLVLPEAFTEKWKSFIHHFPNHIPHSIVDGGPTRFHSVKSGIKVCMNEHPESIVAIHDGVRPFVSPKVLKEGYSVAKLKGSAIPVIPVKETLREVNGAFSKTVPREKYCLVQTPQFFQLGLIADAYNIPYSETFTDDAGVFEASGRQITLIDGNYENMKITHPVDMLFAEKLLSSGYDF
jgi:2-C-methyl-D-erythritol 4-phosphate cytidylyltransferase